MAKSRDTMFFCKECGYESAKWLGQCPGCKEWNSFVEEPVGNKKSPTGISINRGTNKPVGLADISLQDEERISTGIDELDRVLGGGIVEGGLVLVGGDPGIGKSTLLLQMCRNIVNKIKKKVLYISGEESLKQVKLRAQRIGNIDSTFLLLCETNLDNIKEIVSEVKPDVIVIDSIQTMVCDNVTSSAGSVSQVRESTNILMQMAKGYGISVFIVGHVTKEGVVAGPRVLEHMVDTVLYFEGDRHASYRILRAVKNRFGSTNEIGVFEMQNDGLREVENPSEYMLKGRPVDASGTVTSCSVEGTRPILLEIQSLLCKTNFGIPRRTTVGTDYNRVNLILAVLEKKAGLKLYEYDVYTNIAGGLRITEPALDLGIAVSIISGYRDEIIGSDVVAFGEIGLSGEVRAVSMAMQRVQEAAKLGFKKCIIPFASMEEIKKVKDIEVVGVNNIQDVIREIKML